MKNPIIILHGWSVSLVSSKEKYQQTISMLEEKGYQVFAPDLPGFGKNQLKKEELFFDDYVSFVHEYTKTILKKTKNKKVILIGHSFGGRIAIKFASLYPSLIAALVLTGASGVLGENGSLKVKILSYLTRLIKPIFYFPLVSSFYIPLRKALYLAIGELDYLKSGPLSKTFINIYKVSIKNDLTNISVPTLIIWGMEDKVTPLSNGILIQAKIPNSKLIVIPEASHKLPYENANDFTSNIISFINNP